MSATVIPFPKLPSVGNQGCVYVEPSRDSTEILVWYSPGRGGLSTFEGAFDSWDDAHAHACGIALAKGAKLDILLPSGGAA